MNKNSGQSILEYLQKNGAANTFKLAHVLGVKRDKLLGILKNLEEQGSIKIVTGKVEFLSYPISKEKKKQKPKAAVPKKKLETGGLKEKLGEKDLEIRRLKNKIEKLKKLEQPIAEERPLIVEEKVEKIKPKIKQIKQKPKIKAKPIKPKLKKVKKPKKKKKSHPKPKTKKKKIKKFKFKLKLPKLKIPKFDIKKSLKFSKIKKFVKRLKRR